MVQSVKSAAIVQILNVLIHTYSLSYHWVVALGVQGEQGRGHCCHRDLYTTQYNDNSSQLHQKQYICHLSNYHPHH